MPAFFRRLVTPAARHIEREQLRLRLDDAVEIDVLRVRDPRARRLKLSVDERGARLTLPPGASDLAGERFLRQHRDWLLAQMQRQRPDGEAQASLRRFETPALPLRGVAVPLHWHEGHYSKFELREDGVHAQLPARAGDAALARALREFYEAQARADVGGWLPRYLPGLPKAPRAVRWKIMSSQWGSLAPDGTMALDLSLVLARPSAFEYVLVHELCHLIQHNHSPAFWAEVEARCPHWRDERDWFRAEGRRLKATLRSLLAASAQPRD